MRDASRKIKAWIWVPFKVQTTWWRLWLSTIIVKCWRAMYMFVSYTCINVSWKWFAIFYWMHISMTCAVACLLTVLSLVLLLPVGYPLMTISKHSSSGWYIYRSPSILLVPRDVLASTILGAAMSRWRMWATMLISALYYDSNGALKYAKAHSQAYQDHHNLDSRNGAFEVSNRVDLWSESDWAQKPPIFFGHTRFFIHM